MNSSGHRAADEESVGSLVSQAAQQLSQLVRAEVRLAQAEMTQKGKRFGVDGGLFGGAGMLAFVALQALAAAGIAALTQVLPVWASALIITGALLALAALLAAVGKMQVAYATPPAPRQTIESIKADVTEIKERAHR